MWLRWTPDYMSVAFPLNTVNFGGYVMREVYNIRNLRHRTLN